MRISKLFVRDSTFKVTLTYDELVTLWHFMNSNGQMSETYIRENMVHNAFFFSEDLWRKINHLLGLSGTDFPLYSESLERSRA